MRGLRAFPNDETSIYDDEMRIKIIVQVIIRQRRSHFLLIENIYVGVLQDRKAAHDTKESPGRTVMLVIFSETPQFCKFTFQNIN